MILLLFHALSLDDLQLQRTTYYETYTSGTNTEYQQSVDDPPDLSYNREED